MRIRRALPLVFALALPPLFGCATVLHGSRQTIHVETDPPGATVTVAGERHTSPVDVVLPRKSENLEVVVEKDGYLTKRIPLVRKVAGETWLNLLAIPAGAAAGASIGANSSSTGTEFENGAAGMVVGTLALTSLSFSVDGVTGAIYRLEPRAIAVRLEPAPPAPPAAATPVATR
jgi:hypothetical protein